MGRHVVSLVCQTCDATVGELHFEQETELKPVNVLCDDCVAIRRAFKIWAANWEKSTIMEHENIKRTWWDNMSYGRTMWDWLSFWMARANNVKNMPVYELENEK